MKERGILFSGAMVRALLDGTKTQTRRPYKARKHPDFGCEMAAFELAGTPQHVVDRMCLYGKPGDRLWVRETWGVVSNAWDDDGNLVDWVPDRPATAIADMPFGQGYYSGHAIYAADGPYEWAGDDDGGGEPRSAWHPSIHMPRAASRILLEITSVRVERLQDIGEADCWAEGIEACESLLDDVAIIDLAKRMGRCMEDAAPSYAALWESINGASSWDTNPWVWVVEFKRVAATAGKED
jgi:hypothetical protein